eukprot:SAG31_NODE_2061_length_6536_cov_20.366941_1_plen_94_part_00
MLEREAARVLPGGACQERSAVWSLVGVDGVLAWVGGDGFEPSLPFSRHPVLRECEDMFRDPCLVVAGDATHVGGDSVRLALVSRLAIQFGWLW